MSLESKETKTSEEVLTDEEMDTCNDNGDLNYRRRAEVNE